MLTSEPVYSDLLLQHWAIYYKVSLYCLLAMQTKSKIKYFEMKQTVQGSGQLIDLIFVIFSMF